MRAAGVVGDPCFAWAPLVVVFCVSFTLSDPVLSSFIVFFLCCLLCLILCSLRFCVVFTLCARDDPQLSADSHYAPHLRSLPAGYPHKDGTACIKITETANGETAEEITSFDPPERLTYRCVRGGYWIMDHESEVLFDKEPDTGYVFIDALAQDVLSAFSDSDLGRRG